MRILYDHQVFSLQDAGGASRYHFELARNLQHSDEVAIEVLIGLNGSVMPFATLQQPRTRVFGRRTAVKPGVARYATNEVLSAIIAPLRGRVDIYHPTLYRALPWVRRRRVVVTHHDCIHERFPHLFKNAAAIIESKRRLFARADAIVCVSKSSRNDLHRFYDVAEKKSHVVYHGFSSLLSAPANSPPRNGIGSQSSGSLVRSASFPKQWMRHSRAPTGMLPCLFIPVCMRGLGSLPWKR
jgi:glycosyltransferase involved in cell wall biosynthesis